jgi:hypothetical protein
LVIGQQHPNNVCRASLGIVPNFCDQVIVNSLGLALVPRLRKGLAEVSALRSNRSTEEAGKWAEKIKSVNQEVAKANAIVATGRCSVQQLVEHLRLCAQIGGVIQAASECHLDSLISGEWAIILACEEFKCRWGSPKTGKLFAAALKPLCGGNNSLVVCA